MRSIDGIDGARVYETVMGPPLVARVPPEVQGSMVCLWSHPELHEYEMPATTELVIALQTSGPGARTRKGRGWSTVAPTGSLHVVPPRLSTRWKIDGSLGFLSVHIAASRIRSLLDRAGASEAMSELAFRFAVRDPFLTAACRELARELQSPHETGSLYTDLLADTMLLRLLRLGGGSVSPERRVGGLSGEHLRIVQERIEASLETGITLGELADEVGLSRFHLARAFKASTGMPPHRYMTLRRIEVAKQLLSDSAKSLVDVAIEAGFSSQSHFTDRFREITGLTPLRYRSERI